MSNAPGLGRTAAILAWLAAAPAQATDLATSYAGGNANFGEGFSISATTNIDFVGLAINPEAAGATYTPINLYKAAGPATVGAPISFTLVAQSAAFVAGSANAPTVVPITFDVPIAAGTTAVFYIAVTNSAHSLAFTDGGSFGAVLAQDANIAVLQAMTGGETPPTTVVDTHRQFNGTISYTVRAAAFPEPGSLGVLIGAVAVLVCAGSGCRRAAEP